MTIKKLIKIAMPIVCDEFDITAKELRSRRRFRNLVEARFTLWKLLSSEDFGTSEIGRTFKRDHGSIIHGLKRLTILIETEKKTKTRTERIEKLFSIERNK